MDKFKRIVVALGIICAVVIIVRLVLYFFNDNVNPDFILSEVELDLPKYEIIYRHGGLDYEVEDLKYRYMFELKFSPEDSASLTKQLKEKGWRQEFDMFYVESAVDDLEYCLQVFPDKGKAYLDIDKDYFAGIMITGGIFYIMIALFYFVGPILIVWLIIWTIWDRIHNRKEPSDE